MNPYNAPRLSPIALGLATFFVLSAVMAAFADDADAQRRRRRSRQLRSDTLFIRAAFATPGACSPETTFCREPETKLSIAPDLALGLRFGVLALEGRFFYNPYLDRGDSHVGLGGFLSGRVHPLSKGELDPFISFGVGYMAIGPDSLDADEIAEGGTLSIGAGLDYYLARQFAIGLGFDRYFLFPEAEQDGAQVDPEGFWTARLNFTVYFEVNTTSSRRPKKTRPRPNRPRPRRKPKKELH